jgi:hypothetical protein
MYMDDEKQNRRSTDGELGKCDGGIALQSQRATSLSLEKQTVFAEQWQDQFVVLATKSF